MNIAVADLALVLIAVIVAYWTGYNDGRRIGNLEGRLREIELQNEEQT